MQLETVIATAFGRYSVPDRIAERLNRFPRTKQSNYLRFDRRHKAGRIGERYVRLVHHAMNRQWMGVA